MCTSKSNTFAHAVQTSTPIWFRSTRTGSHCTKMFPIWGCSHETSRWYDSIAKWLPNYFSVDFVRYFQTDSSNKILPKLFSESTIPLQTASASKTPKGEPKNKISKHNVVVLQIEESSDSDSESWSDVESVADSERAHEHAEFIADCVDFVEYYKYMKAGIFDCHACYKRFASRQSLCWICMVLAVYRTCSESNQIRSSEKSFRNSRQISA